MGAALGQPFLPWQSHAADLIGELLPNGLPAFREAIVTVMRQQGKSTLLLSHSLERCTLRGSAQKVAYTAQTGSDARKKLLDDQAPLLMGSPLRAAVHQVHRAAGNEGIRFKNGSRIDVLASGVSAGHGKIIDLGEIDEAFDDVDDRREQAIIPAMMTRPDAQMLITSTMGTDASVYLNRKVEMGRAAALEGRTSGTAYIEYAIPEDEDVYDPEVWRRFMPAFGFTITEAVVAHASTTMTEGEFRRAFGNQRMRGMDRWSAIPETTWRLACAGAPAPSGVLSFAVEVAPDRDWTAIGVAGGGVVELVDYRPGTGWAPARLKELTAAHGGVVALELRSPAGGLVPELRSAGVRVVELSAAEVTQACGGFYDGLADSRVRVNTRPALDTAVEHASRQPVGDAWRFGRKGAIDVSPLLAVTIAQRSSVGGDGPSVYEERGVLVL